MQVLGQMAVIMSLIFHSRTSRLNALYTGTAPLATIVLSFVSYLVGDFTFVSHFNGVIDLSMPLRIPALELTGLLTCLTCLNKGYVHMI